MKPASVRIAVLTPPGRGAVATIAVEGPGAQRLVAECFQPLSGASFERRQARRIAFGLWRSDFDDESGEELVVCPLDDARVMIHCHGGKAAVEAIVKSLTDRGAIREAAEEWTLRNEPNRLAAEARGALAEAKTERTALVLLDQYQGALRRETEEIRDEIQAGRTTEAMRRLDILLVRVPFGLHCTRPWRVAIVGRPNVGKSSLMNALLGYSRSIVFDQPGTTRDVLTACTALDGLPIEFVDTAGLRITDDPLEAAGVERANEECTRADLILHVTDAESDEASIVADAAVLRVRNKVDLETSSATAGGMIRVSARTGEGMDELQRAVVAKLVPDPPASDDAVPFTERQASILRGALELMQRTQFIEACDELARLWLK